MKDGKQHNAPEQMLVFRDTAKVGK